MKKIFYSLFAAALLLGAVSCSSDDNNSSVSASEITATVTSGTWRITAFSEDGTDETNHFAGYNFTFAPTNVLTATNGTNNYQGIWSATSHDDSDDDNPGSDLDFNILFSSPDTFTELNEDWEILERTSSRIKLRHVSGGNGGTDYLTFEKNS